MAAKMAKRFMAQLFGPANPPSPWFPEVLTRAVREMLGLYGHTGPKWPGMVAASYRAARLALP
jgi:hypothetical protein